jgi:hypothetical protein
VLREMHKTDPLSSIMGVSGVETSGCAIVKSVSNSVEHKARSSVSTAVRIPDSLEQCTYL